MREKLKGLLLGVWLRKMHGCQGHSLRWGKDECGVVKLWGSGGKHRREHRQEEFLLWLLNADHSLLCGSEER